jgi:lipopolysaccharide cholinephosphotransferase
LVVSRLNKFLKSYPTTDSIQVGSLLGPYKDKDIFNKKLFKETILLEFEGNYFLAPAEYDILLSQLYGSYMELPSLEKRVTHHSYRAFYK